MTPVPAPVPSQIRLAAALCLVITLFLAPSSQAQEAPYARDLVRLAEVLGALHYLSHLCGIDTEDWRERTSALIDAAQPDTELKARLVAAFNRGFEAYSAAHRTCTPATRAIIDRYLEEGEAKASDLAARFAR